jgi:uncharacterized membrane-anchored protein
MFHNNQIFRSTIIYTYIRHGLKFITSTVMCSFLKCSINPHISNIFSCAHVPTSLAVRVYTEERKWIKKTGYIQSVCKNVGGEFYTGKQYVKFICTSVCKNFLSKLQLCGVFARNAQNVRRIHSYSGCSLGHVV